MLYYLCTLIAFMIFLKGVGSVRSKAEVRAENQEQISCLARESSKLKTS